MENNLQKGYFTMEKKTYMSVEQKELLVECMKNYPQLVSGKFSVNFSIKDAEKLWINITKSLNDLPGAVKDWKQWRKTWQDLRNKTKSKKAEILKYHRRTGGGPPAEEHLSQTEENIIEIIGPAAASGLPEVSESVADYDFHTEWLESDVENLNIFLDPDENKNMEIVDNSTMDITSDYNQNVKQSPIISTKLHTELTNKNTETVIDSRAGCKTSRRRALQRLDNSIGYTNRVADAAELDVAMRQKYYNQKIELLERMANAKERIATALEKLSSGMQ